VLNLVTKLRDLGSRITDSGAHRDDVCQPSPDRPRDDLPSVARLLTLSGNDVADRVLIACGRLEGRH